MTTKSIGPTQALCRLIAGLRFETLPASVIERTKDLVLDHIGVTLLGSTLEWSGKVRDVVVREEGRAESTIYGHGRVPARAAALVNGSASHAVEFDDTHDESLSHPGAVIMPAAIAIAEARDCSGQQFLSAIVAGYEAQCRIGSALGRALIERGFHPTATLGVYGAAGAVGSLLKLDEKSLLSAFGSAASMSSGVMQFTEDPENTMIKRMHAGLPAERGLLAALLAAEGFTGPNEAIEGQYGFGRILAGTTALDRITQDLGSAYEIERISVKLYPCCKQFHSLIEAIEECKAREQFTHQDVVALEPFGPRAIFDTHMEYRPESMMSAQYSMPYTAAAAIVMDVSSPVAFDGDARSRADIHRLSDMVKPSYDEDLQAMYPRRFPAGVRISLRDGRKLTHTVLDARSSPDNPVGHTHIEKKFRTLTADLLSSQRQQEIINTIAALDSTASVRQLADLIVNTHLSRTAQSTQSAPKQPASTAGVGA